MITNPKQNRNTVLTSVIVMAILIVGGFLFFAEPEGESVQVAESGAVLDVATVSESVPVVLPDEVYVPILVYHHVRPTPAGTSAMNRQYTVTSAEFESHLKYLRDNDFTGVLLTDIRAALLEGTELPDKPVAITFDDGRLNQYDNAIPLLREYGFVATFSPFTNAIGRPGYVTWEQLAEMRDAGHDIGSHGIFHPYMTRLGDAELQHEAGKSREVLREHLDMEIAVFSHPFGLYDERTVAVLEDSGYTVGRGLKHAAVHTRDDLMSLGSYISTASLGYLVSVVGE